MDVIQPIRQSFADEHVIGTDPPMRPELSGYWRRKINAFAGRALSDKAMTAEQDLRSGMQRLFGLSLSPGCVEGLAVTPERAAIGVEAKDAAIQISPGIGIARSGEDISFGRTVRLPLGDIQVVIRVDHADSLADEDNVDPEIPRRRTATGSAMTWPGGCAPKSPGRIGQQLAAIAANKASATLPHVAVLVAQPVAAEILGRPGDDCPPDPRDDAYVDLQRIDGARLLLYLWPAEMVAIDGGPDYALPGRRCGAAQPAGLRGVRDRAAADRGRDASVGGLGRPARAGRLHRRLEARLRRSPRGCPRRRHAAAALVGGALRRRCPAVAGAARPVHRADRRSSFVRARSAARRVRAHAAGRGAARGDVRPEQRRQKFFPSGFQVDAVPVAHSNFNLAISESAGLAPYDRGQPDAVELLVPVPDALY